MKPGIRVATLFLPILLLIYELLCSNEEQAKIRRRPLSVGFCRLNDNIVQNGSIRLEQGRKTDVGAPISSGNEYDDILGQQFTNFGTLIRYHHIINTTQELIEFTDTTTIKLIQSNPNTTCDEEECPPPCDTEMALASIKTQFLQEKQVWVAKTADRKSVV